MAMFTRQRELFSQGANPKETIDTITIGVVVDTNDPQQMGRVRALCVQWGDSHSTPVEDLPWASYVSPFGGQVSVGTRGSGIQESEGGIAYGMWAIPKIGAQVMVMCVDGDPMLRVYLGCIFDQLTTHTMPHGRYMYDDHPALEKNGTSPTPHGPYTSREKAIEPLTTNMRQAFGNQGDPNHEYRTRAADYTVSALDVEHLNNTYSGVPDDKNISYEDWFSTQGYSPSRIDPHAESSYTDRNYDSSVYSITTPGFHAISMDDRQENCRVKVRTTSGHQILMDDTNERIYIATAKGNNWIEMDQDGNIDIFSSNKVNIRTKEDINFTADGTIRMHAGKGIHMYSGEEVRIEAQKDIHVKTPLNIRTHATQNIYFEAGQEFDVSSGSDMKLTTATTAHVKAGIDLMLTSAAATHVKAGSNMMLDSVSTTHVNAGSSILASAAAIHLNGPPASSANLATSASLPNEQPAFWTNRKTDHEPWARTMTKNDFTHDPEFIYTDRQVNRLERGRVIPRGMHWRR